MNELRPKSKGRPLKCQNCDHEWVYRGNQDRYCTCPHCLYKVNIKKARQDKNNTDEE